MGRPAFVMGILSSLLNAIPFMASFSPATLASEVPTAEGLVPFTVNGETYNTWYKQFGQLNTSQNLPLIVVHGGPGLSHDYLLPLSDLAGERTVIMYDQLGSSRSTHLQEKPGSFWTIDLFIDELENLIRHFDIQEGFDLLGHSWGGMLGMEYEVRRHPAGLRHLVVTNSLASMGLWNEANAKLASEFPKDIQEGLGKGFADPEKYHAALTEFYAVHGCTVKPNPKEFDYSLGQVFGPNRDTSVPNAMFGGEIKEWDIRERLGDIHVPTLVINGRADISMDFVVKPLAEGIKGAKWVTFERSSHTPMWEEREKYMQVVKDFLINQV